jgi:hypothetical protein
MRSLEDHLSPQELASLPDSPETLASGGPDQQQLSQHLERCEACSSLAQIYWSLRSLRGVSTSATGESCPEQDTWLEFAAGLNPKQSPHLLAHASQCTKCAGALKEAMQLMQADQLEDTAEADPIKGLASATPEWQHQLATRLAAQIRPVAPRFTLIQNLRQWPTWMTLPIAAALLCVAIPTGFALWNLVHPSDSRLLAEAYNKQRTLALRIPGAEPVPMAFGTRGPATIVPVINQPDELDKLNSRAKELLKRPETSSYGHQLLGEVDLLNHNLPDAEYNFRAARDGNPNLSNLQIDNAALLFESAEGNHNIWSYGKAAELYSEQIQKLSGSSNGSELSLLYYNRALCWERMNLKSNALSDLQSALKAEPSERWRQEITVEISRLSATAASSQTDGYEAALNNATEQLLPQWNDSADARTKILYTAAMGLRHNDSWLQQWVAARHTQQDVDADRYLAAAVLAAGSGRAEESLAAAKNSVILYRSTANQPGLLRGLLALSYAQQRLGRNNDCLKSIKSALRNPSLREFTWLEARLMIEQAECSSTSEDYDTGRASLERASSLISGNDLPMLAMRIDTNQADSARLVGSYATVWKICAGALERCNTIKCSPGLEYPFMYLLSKAAQSADLPHVAAEIMRSAEPVAARTGNATTHAYALEELATLFSRIGQCQEAEKSFHNAMQIIRSDSKTPPAAIYQADWQTDWAKILNCQSRYQEAIAVLEHSGPALLHSEYSPGRLHYWSVLAETQRDLGKTDASLASAWTAVHESERSLLTLHSTIERERWEQANQISYIELVKSYLQEADDTEALRAWERFRLAPYRTQMQQTSAAPTLVPTARASMVLVLARLDAEYFGWLVDGDTQRVLERRDLGTYVSIAEVATGFYNLCSQPDSSPVDVKAAGSQLYSMLIAPFATRIGSSDRIWIDADDELAILPFAALVRPNGDWLGASTQISMLPAWWTAHPQAALADQSVNASMHLLAVSGFGDLQTEDSETPELAMLFPHATLLQGVSADRQHILSSLPAANIFHFSGHASTSSDSGALLTMANNLSSEDLGSVHLPHCQVGVLAACNTASAGPDQLQKIPDLRNALRLAGVRSVVASNWDVDDRSTRALMSTFYKQLAAGHAVSQSLQFAEEEVRSQKVWQHPYYWAPFEVFNN